MQKPNWDNNTSKIQVLNNIDDDAINSKTQALRLRGGKSNETSSRSKKKWSIYNVLKDEAQEQLKNYNDHRKLCIHPNDQNGIKIGFLQFDDTNKEFQNEKNYNVMNDTPSNIQNDYHNNFERKNQHCQTYTPPIFLDEISKKDNMHDKKSKAQYYNMNRSNLKSSNCKRMSKKDNCNNTHINKRQSTLTNSVLNGIYDPMVNFYTHNFIVI